jgi:hypothetical protein
MQARRGLRLVIGALALAYAPFLFAAPADDIKALLDKGNSAAAYALGKKHPEELGKPQFDFYFGVAAIDSGHAGEGVLALERYTINFPGNVQAKLELARGYFILGDDLRAREEFNEVLKSSPPPAVTANIERYLDAIRARESAYRTTAGVFVEFGLGYDSNINGGVTGSNVVLPNFGLVTIAPAGVKIHSTFGQLTAGANVVHPVVPGIAVFGSVLGDYKLHSSHDEFDQGSLGVAGGVSYLKDKNQFRATLSYNQMDVDYNRFRNVAGITGEWMHQLDELRGLGAYLQYAELDYTGNNDARDAYLTSIGASYRHAFIGKWQPLMVLSANLGEENNRRNRDDLGRDLYGVRAAVSFTPAPKWGAAAGITYQHSDYAAPDALFGTTRKDKYYAVDFTTSYAWTKKLSLRGEVVLSKNSSNLALYEYDRDLFAVKLRYDFQ